jgi:hypothetical protein
MKKIVKKFETFARTTGLQPFDHVSHQVSLLCINYYLYLFIYIGVDFLDLLFGQIFIPDLWPIFHPKPTVENVTDNYGQDS